ncbi:60S ribosomal protein L30-like [Tripterygium wilfordii]|uniref:60S ribosomal protein L30-like n=1 Tax=Tripterygium wilfordii TaxID=458696 RepID=A0A7J7DL63_TRIWF|nr:60S ribosomal protein L30-like [Tripterygium wilfordii]
MTKKLVGLGAWALYFLGPKYQAQTLAPEESSEAHKNHKHVSHTCHNYKRLKPLTVRLYPSRSVPAARLPLQRITEDLARAATMVAGKKTKKTHESINNRLALVMKSGKYTLGYKTVLRTLRGSKAKLVLISNNCPPLRKSEIEYYAMLAKVGVHHYNGNNVDMGTACGKYFRVSCLSIIDPGTNFSFIFAVKFTSA